MIRPAVLLALFIPALAHAAGTTAADLGRRILDAGLDPDECYQVRELRFNREDARLYLTEGLLIFGKPVNGVRLSAVFSGDVEGGDAELLVMPPHRSERLSLASFSGSPNLDEHFRTAIFLFSDDTYPELLKLIAAHGEIHKRPEQGVLLAATWDGTVRNLSRSFQVRTVKDLLGDSRASNGYFHTALMGQKLGNIDLIYDPRSSEQVVIGQVSIRYNRGYFDLWTRFQARSFRNHQRAAPPEDALVSNYRIEAELGADLKLQGVTEATVVLGRDSTHAIQFDLSPQVEISEATIAGEPLEVFQPDSLRANLVAGGLNQAVLLVPSKPLEAGREYVVRMKHSGSVISDAGNGVYFVGSRGSWYPHRFPQFARYDLTFRYPRDLDLVATGKMVEQSEQGALKVARYRIETPVRMAGFNLGRFEHRSVTRGGYTVDVYANRGLEEALRPKREMVVMPPQQGPPGDRHWTVDLAPFPEGGPTAGARLEQFALDIAGGLEFMAGHFGPPVLRNLTVSPIPGTFGQGFPGLIYLSTLAYLDPRYRPAQAQGEIQRLFYSEVMPAHETAHQWWGNVVASAGAEDDWMMEALANYSALLYLEKHKGPRAVDQLLADYRARLLSKTSDGVTIESVGPIIWGERLTRSKAPDAWRTITYEKGSWIMHMLRRRLGDERFLAMLGQLRKRYQFRTMTSDDLRITAAEALPPGSFDPRLEAFFEQWVYATGVPSFKMQYAVQRKGPSWRVTGAITQQDAPEDFATWVPLEIRFPKGKPLVQWVRTTQGSAPFSVAVRQAPSKVLLDPENSVLHK
ncbi:MAG TPA: M1 family aminopeptidase [Bryobacteraceae bacterium]